jgi:uncharacterized membrane protein YgaE (UPF0421/DUF939 family)
LTAAVRRVRAVAGPVLETSAAAGIAWFVARDVLGHTQPFFAPIAAAVAMSTSHVQRARRSVQMVIGVLLGIGVAELLQPLFGSSSIAIAVVVLVTLVLAVAVAVGFVGEGLMFVNQAAGSAILVVALHRAGTGGERAIDALVGGAVALVIGVGLFPVEPLKLLWRAEGRVLSAIASVLAREPLPAARGRDPDMDWPLAASHEVHRRLTALTAARSTARANVRIAPRRMHLRGEVDAEERRVAGMYLLASGALSLVRVIADAEAAGAQIEQPVLDEVDSLALAVRSMRSAERPWSALALVEPRRRASEVIAAPRPGGGPESAAVAIAARRVAHDLIAVLPAEDAWEPSPTGEDAGGAHRE